MTQNTKIEWATHTFSPWICRGDTRRRTAESTWKHVEKWNRKAACGCKWTVEATGTHYIDCPQHDRPRVFPSLCDPFEDWGGVMLDSSGVAMLNGPEKASGSHAVRMADVRRDFFALIDRCPNLDFLLLTKRPENAKRMMERAARSIVGENWPSLFPWPNVWLIYSASDQQSLDAGLPHLLACRDLAPVLGLSLEPLVGPVDLGLAFCNAMMHGKVPIRGSGRLSDFIRWVICGGESGPHARPMDIAWLESIAEQCAAAGVPLWVKQDAGRKPGQQGRIPDALWARKELPT